MVEFAGGDGDGRFVDDGEILGVGDEQGEIGEAVEAAGESVGGVVQRGQGGGGERGGAGRPGGREPAEDVGRRLGLGQRAEPGSGPPGDRPGRGAGRAGPRPRRRGATTGRASRRSRS